MTEVRHRNIIKLYGFCCRKGCLYLVYEYVEWGSLRKVLYGVEGELELGWAKRVKIVQGVAHAIAYLHNDCSLPIVHRDVSVNNTLLESEFEPRLSDFGTARLLSSESSNWTTVTGSYGYMAPGNPAFYLPVYSCLHFVMTFQSKKKKKKKKEKKKKRKKKKEKGKRLV